MLPRRLRQGHLSEGRALPWPSLQGVTGARAQPVSVGQPLVGQVWQLCQGPLTPPALPLPLTSPSDTLRKELSPPLIKPGWCQEVGDGGTHVGVLPTGLTFQAGVSSGPPSSSASSSPSAWSCRSSSSSPSVSSSCFRPGCCCQGERETEQNHQWGQASPAPWGLSPKAKSSQWAVATGAWCTRRASGCVWQGQWGG